MSGQGIDEENGVINVYELLPKAGDSITVINCGDHFEIRHQHFEFPPLVLTEHDIECMKLGTLVIN